MAESECLTCEGQGRLLAARRWDGLRLESVQDTYCCPVCGGRGTIPDTATSKLDRAIRLHDNPQDPAPPPVI